MGITSGCLLAADVWRLGDLRWNARTLMLKPLAGTHKSPVAKMTARYPARTEIPHGLAPCVEARRRHDSKKHLIARSGGIPLNANKDAVIHDHAPAPVPEE